MGRPKRDDLEFLGQAAVLWDAEDLDVGYLARIFTQTALPYRDPGSLPAWGRRNGGDVGDVALVVQPGMTMDRLGQPVSLGFPYGVIPRLLLTWLSTEAVRTRRRDLPLGESLSDFMRQLGLVPTGGRSGTITRLRGQIERLFRATIAVRYTPPSDGQAERAVGSQMSVATSYDLWWTARDHPGATPLWPSFVRLSDEFFCEVTERPVPVSMDALRLLRGSALQLDIYAWLTYRASYLRRRTEIAWDALGFQFGSQYADSPSGRHKFRVDFEGHLRRVLAVYPDANVETSPGALILLPSRTHVSRRSRTSLSAPGNVIEAAAR